MVTYVVLAKFTDQGVRKAKESPKRADAFKELAKTFGVTVKEILWTQGQYDIVTLIEAPDESSAMSLNWVQTATPSLIEVHLFEDANENHGGGPWPIGLWSVRRGLTALR